MKSDEASLTVPASITGRAPAAMLPPVQESKRRVSWIDPDYKGMFLLAGLCGVCTFAGFVLHPFAPRLSIALFVVAYLSGGWFASIELAGELRRGVFDINLLMIVVAIGAAGIGA